MPIENESVVFDVEAGAAIDAARTAADGSLRSLVEFDAERFNPLYVDDATLSFYEDEEHALEHFARIHSYVHVDLTEIDLLTEELFPIAEDVEYIATAMDAFTVVRLYVDDRGLFLALDPGEPVEPVVEALRAVFEDGRE